MPRLSPQTLYALRNHLNIDQVITQLLQIPTQQINAIVRFQCPRCARFHTATQPSTNLARCFDCRKNFNTIELVMAVRQLPFLEAVAVLQRYQNVLANPSCTSPNPNPVAAAVPVADVKTEPTQQQTPTTPTSHLIAIKEILNKR